MTQSRWVCGLEHTRADFQIERRALGDLHINRKNSAPEADACGMSGRNGSTRYCGESHANDACWIRADAAKRQAEQVICYLNA